MIEGSPAWAPGATVVATVKWYDPVKGFGFLAPVDGSRVLFCHASAVSDAGWLTLPEGASVTCEVEQGRRGSQVSRIHVVDASTASPGPGESRGSPRVERGDGHGAADASSARRVVASVKWFVPSRGFGFLAPADSSPDVFCHASAVRDAGYDALPQGATVTCAVTEGRRGPMVSSIVAVDASTTSARPAGRDEPYRDRGERSWDRAEPAGPVEERSGLVKFYDAARGYGFVVPDGGGPDVFVPGSVKVPTARFLMWRSMRTPSSSSTAATSFFGSPVDSESEATSCVLVIASLSAVALRGRDVAMCWPSDDLVERLDTTPAHGRQGPPSPFRAWSTISMPSNRVSAGRLSSDRSPQGPVGAPAWLAAGAKPGQETAAERKAAPPRCAGLVACPINPSG